MGRLEIYQKFPFHIYRFTKSPEWVQRDDDDKYDLPARVDPNWIIMRRHGIVLRRTGEYLSSIRIEIVHSEKCENI